jgi:carbamoyltransferase
VQGVLEETLVDLTRSLQRETGLRDLCLGGGVALNGVANARIACRVRVRSRVRSAAPGDAGCALGAALYADRIYFGNLDREIPDHPFWGPRVDPQELAGAAREDGQVVEELDEAVLIDRVAGELAAGRIVGWMDGASEFGPRALGHRSILTAPHSVEMRDRLNRDIKFREEFRPFAPIVTGKRPGAISICRPGGLRLARFMSGVFPVRPEWRTRLAAVTHVDGSARPAGARARDGATNTRIARSVRPEDRDSRAAQYVLQYRGRTDREPRAGGLLDRSDAAVFDVLVAGSVVVTKARLCPAAAARGGH